MIGEDLRVVVVSTANGKVHVGVDAPRSVTVLRREVWERERARGLTPLPEESQGHTDA